MSNFVKLNMTYRLNEKLSTGITFQKEAFIEALDKALEKSLFVIFSNDPNSKTVDIGQVSAVIESYKLNRDNTITFRVKKLETKSGKILESFLDMGDDITLSPRAISSGYNGVIDDVKILAFYIDRPLDWIEKIVGRNKNHFN